MAKKNKSKNKSKQSKKQLAAPAEEEKVTLEAIAAMSDSDDEDVPESQWNDKAKTLASAIKSGKFDDLLKQMKQNSEDEDEMEEATLGSSSAEEDDEEEDMEEQPKSSSKSSKSKKQAAQEASEDEEEEDDDEEEETENVGEEEGDSDKEGDQREEEESESSEEEQEDMVGKAKMKELKANNANNAKALSVVTAELVAAHAKLPWAETFDVIPATPLPFGENGDADSNPLDVHDDLKREVAFYKMALEGVHAARKHCKKANVPFSRPDDFFAEMVKTDDHMAKVKDRLIFENKKMEAVAQRKTNREQKLRAKEAQSNKLAEKARRKKEHFQQVEEWANSVAKNRGGGLQDDVDEMYLNSGKGGPNKKRQAADRKFGHGGKRGRFKQNDRATLNDMSGYNPRGNFPGGMKKSASKGGGGANRQGKRARDASRSRRG